MMRAAVLSSPPNRDCHESASEQWEVDPQPLPSTVVDDTQFFNPPILTRCMTLPDALYRRRQNPRGEWYDNTVYSDANHHDQQIVSMNTYEDHNGAYQSQVKEIPWNSDVGLHDFNSQWDHSEYDHSNSPQKT